MREHPDIQQPPPGEEVFLAQAAHAFLENEPLKDKADAEDGQGKTRVEKQADDEEGIEQEVGCGIEAKEEFVPWLIKPRGAVVAGLLAEPFIEGFFGL